MTTKHLSDVEDWLSPAGERASRRQFLAGVGVAGVSLAGFSPPTGACGTNSGGIMRTPTGDGRPHMTFEGDLDSLVKKGPVFCRRGAMEGRIEC